MRGRSQKERVRFILLPNHFKKATVPQLMQIILHEECPPIYKCVAEDEIRRREEEDGTKILPY